MGKINNIKCLIAIIFLGLFFCGQYYIDFGFALKPYMLGAGVIFLFYILPFRKKYRFSRTDGILLVFLVTMLMSLIFSKDSDASIRFFLGTCLIVFCYLQYKTFIFSYLNKEIFEKAVAFIGLIYGVLVGINYVLGLFFFNFNFYGNDISAYGVLIDRSIPRLITFASDDPNISFLFLSFFLCFYLCNLKKSEHYIGFAMYFGLCMLTMSRAAYISISVMILLFVLHNKRETLNKKFFNSIVVVLSVSIIVFTVSVLFDIDIIETMLNRFGSDSAGSSSVRLTLWKNALHTFVDYPIVGIGINSSLFYNLFTYGTFYYIHNTYLEVLSEVGFFGFVVYILLLLDIFVKNRNNRSVSLFPYCYTVSIFIQNFFLSTLINEMFFVLLITTSIYNEFRLNKINNK